MFKCGTWKIILSINITLTVMLFLASDDLFAILGDREAKTLEDLESKGGQDISEDGGMFKKPYLEYNAYHLRDPFEDLLTRKTEESRKAEAEMAVDTSPPPLDIKGLVWGGKTPQAIINDKVVARGDVIDGAEIIDISKDGVTVLYKKRIYKLSSPASNDMAAGNEEVNQ